MIDLRNVEIFFWIATLGSFRAAAAKLNTTQPAISQRMASLEADLGVRLFEREARGVKLTAKGQELVSHAERLLQARHEMLRAAREESVMTGRLRIGTAETIVQTWLPRLMERIHAAYPALTLEIDVDTTSVLRTQLIARHIDVAFLMGPLLEPDIENLPLCRYPLAWVASPRLDLGPEPLALEQIAHHPVITYPSSSTPYQLVREMLAQASISPFQLYGSASVALIVRMACDGIGTGVVAPVCLRDELARGELRLLDVDAEGLPDLSFTAAWIQGPGSHAAQTIARMAQYVASEI